MRGRILVGTGTCGLVLLAWVALSDSNNRRLRSLESEDRIRRRAQHLGTQNNAKAQLAFLEAAASPQLRGESLRKALEKVGPWATNQSSGDNLIKARAPPPLGKRNN